MKKKARQAVDAIFCRLGGARAAGRGRGKQECFILGLVDELFVPVTQCIILNIDEFFGVLIRT